LQTAFLNEARPDRRNVRLGVAKRVRRGMDRVVPQDEIVLVRSGRAENELGIGQCFEFDRFARRLESREVPVPQLVRRRQDVKTLPTLISGRSGIILLIPRRELALAERSRSAPIMIPLRLWKV
jgi:hypothetical protein